MAANITPPLTAQNGKVQKLYLSQWPAITYAAPSNVSDRYMSPRRKRSVCGVLD
jgi:hypothetical protein